MRRCCHHGTDDVRRLKGYALEDGTRHMPLVVRESQSHQRATRVLAPVRSEQAAKGRDKVQPLGAGRHLRGEGGDLRGLLNHAKRVTEPVDPDRAAGDGTLERITCCSRRAELVQGGR